ncbi:hypothetical protein JQ594_30070 [Bradyrhizobium manausense]|uniref:hypothetical protein n=1 Tax=Bradyrhizobium manausense TaxID=989370 RepID=UPI001BA6E834|nr:hypothetical protein [Bradyrhizobium manausense]MBR0690188.1 hypothetical protein [Bradyrhizobium manausense]
MFDAQCDLGALVYALHHDPDATLRDFAASASDGRCGIFAHRLVPARPAQSHAS